jgi:AraC-like DNA-binding protein
LTAAPLRRTSTPTILALLDDKSRGDRLRAAFGAALETSDSQPRLVVASRASGIELVIVTPRDSSGHSLATTVAAIRASRQGAPVYVYADRSVDGIRELMPLARAGARGVIIRDADDDAASRRRLLVRGSMARALETVTLAVQQVVPARQLPLLMLCIENIGEQQTASAFARRLGVSRRTLSAWASKSGARGVRSLSSRCRTLAAIALIRDSGRSLEHVAHALRFSSSAHLHNTMRRYTGMLPREAAASDLAWWSRQLLVASPAGAMPSREKRLRGR